MPKLNSARWQQAKDLASRWTREQKLPALSFLTGTADQIHGPISFGVQHLEEQTPLVDNPIYLIASITKPIVAMGALMLIERGLIRLSDRVTDYLPQFGKQGKYSVEIRHLLTHTSGLPDMLPNNVALRKENAPLSKFLSETCAIPLTFPVGRAVQYQSMGFLVLAEILQQVTGIACDEFLQRELFQPLGMVDTALGAPESWFDGTSSKSARIPMIRVPADQVGETDWNWNSRYWYQLGAPWGGLLTTTTDLAKFAQVMLRAGRMDDGTALFSPRMIATATTNQLDLMGSVPEDERRCRPWGFGWRMNWPAQSASFGDFLSRSAYGHWGATGTLMWIDPVPGTFAILFSTEPYDESGAYLIRLSNAISAAWDE